MNGGKSSSFSSLLKKVRFIRVFTEGRLTLNLVERVK